MVAVALRELPVPLAAAVSVTLPLPVPLAALSVSHVALLVAVQVVPDGVTDTVTACVPPDADALHVDGVTVNVFTPPAWVTVTV